MTRRSVKPTTKREIAIQSNSWDSHYAILSNRPAKYQVEVPDARKPVQHSDPDELEGAVMKEVASVLKTHPRIVFAMRVNSGAAWMPSKGGKDAPVAFYRIVRNPMSYAITIVDFTGWYGKGTSVLPFAFECKRRSWKYKGDAREVAQGNYLKMIEAFGGIASFITSGQQVINLLDGKNLYGEDRP